ncbi:MAG: hypothetical protein IPM50_01080 [Acidobacteriota bacterium]|nr:MAG: hypothetical protein IPM50_01080 [Acidobacteriota bacterium]
MDQLSPAVSVLFILTTFVTVGILLHGAKKVGIDTLPTRILVFVLPLWILFQGMLATGGFYANTASERPHLLIFGVGPAFLFSIFFVLGFRGSFIQRLPLTFLIGVHIVRIPVEIVLYLLYERGLVPREMTFVGYNFDIATGILAVLLFVAYKRTKNLDRRVLWAFNLVGLLLLGMIVVTAVLSLPGPTNALNVDKPNIGVLLFPYVWLPTMIVPIVLFAHLASLTQLIVSKENGGR